MWRRISAGLTFGQQKQFIQDLTPTFLDKNKIKIDQESIETWMTISNMELLETKTKTKIAKKLLNEIINKKSKSQLFWSFSRLASRNLLYSSIDRVISAKKISKWIVKIISKKWKNPKPVIKMISNISEKTGDKVRDIDYELRLDIINWIRSYEKFDSYIKKIKKIRIRKKDEEKVIFGDSIPSGIIFKTKQ
jgi:hypothetical protein